MSEYISTMDVAQMLGGVRPVSRQAVAAIAAREGWRRLNNERPYQYHYEDVQDYIISKDHTERAKKGGFVSMRGLLRHKKGFNRFCPYCNPAMYIDRVS